jgi:hypothetical protein
VLGDFGFGILSEFFGPIIAGYLSRFKLRVIFFASVFGVELVLFLGAVRVGGWQFAWQRMMDKAFTPLGILLPLGIGVLCVLLVVIQAPDMVGKPKGKK